MINDLIKIKEKIETLLIRFPETRNDDRELIIMYAEEFVIHGSNPSNWSFRGVMKKMPSLESITRDRRRLQQEFIDLKPLNQVKRSRYKEEEQVRELMRDTDFSHIKLF